MSPRVYFHAIVRLGTASVRVLPVIILALQLGLLTATSAQAQSNLSSDGWQVAPTSHSLNRAPVSKETAPPQDNGWRPRSTPVREAETFREEAVSYETETDNTQVLTTESVFEDSAPAKPSRTLSWQSQAAAPTSTRHAPSASVSSPAPKTNLEAAPRSTHEAANSTRHVSKPAATRSAAVQSSHPKTKQETVRTSYEFEDPPAEHRPVRNARPGGPNSLEPIPTPDPVPTPIPNSTHSDVIEDDHSELISDGLDGDVDLADESCGCCENCGHCTCIFCCRPFAGKLWVRGEYLLWWSPGYTVPAMLTTSSSNDPRTAGRLNELGTTVLFGNGKLADEKRSGLRIGAGYLLMPCRNISLEGYYTTTGTLDNSYATNSNIYATLARPFDNVLNAAQGPGADLISFPGQGTGSVIITATSEFSTAEMLLRKKVRDGDNFHVDFLCGYRYARLEEQLLFSETQVIPSSSILRFPGNTVGITDDFHTLNEFNGGQFGFTFSEQYNRWTLDIVAKMSLGSTRTQVMIDGNTIVTSANGASNVTTSYPGRGILAQPSNSGIFETNSITAIPELGIKLGLNLSRRIKLSAGYNFIYWSKVARPGDQIDSTLNSSAFAPNTPTGSAFPKYPGKTTDFWMQGVTAGLEYRF